MTTEKNKPETTWEERVIALEGTVKTLTGQIGERDQLLAESQAKVTALESAVEAHQVAAVDRAKRDRESYVADIQSKATAAGCPLDKEQMGLVGAAFERGDETGARQLGDVFVKTATAMGAARSSGGQIQTLAPQAAGGSESVATATAELFAAAGIKE